MRHHGKTLAALLLTMALAVPALACMWDYDTLMMERQRFPDVLELITGKFLRHSPEFYQWRIEDRLKKLEADPTNLAHMDDLAVAYDKTGQHQKAIDTMLAKNELKPGLYETEANLGTFYIHSGQLEKGVEHVERAIEINPDAHFGREVYQKYLVEYVLSKPGRGALDSPPERTGRWGGDGTVGFAVFVLEAVDATDDLERRNAELEKARKGILGMMRFGHYDSPVLLEALGDILLSEAGKSEDSSHSEKDGKRLAARAYLKASYESNDPSARDTFRRLANSGLNEQTIARSNVEQLPLETLETVLAGELADAERWYAAVQADEIAWIKDGLNVDEEFANKYYEEPEVFSPELNVPNQRDRRRRIAFFMMAGLVTVSLLVATAIVVVWRRRRKAA